MTALRAFCLTFSLLVLQQGLQAAHAPKAPLRDLHNVIRNERLSLACTEPSDLVPTARNLIQEYLEGNILNSTFFQDFLWLHPEKEEFLSCIICASEFPNDRIWERDFEVQCPSYGSRYFNEKIQHAKL